MIKLWDNSPPTGTAKPSAQGGEPVPDLYSMLEFDTRINEVHSNREGPNTYFLVVQGTQFILFKDALEELAKEQVQSEIEFV